MELFRGEDSGTVKPLPGPVLRGSTGTMTDSMSRSGAQEKPRDHRDQPLLAGHEPEAALAMGRRMAEPADDDGGLLRPEGED